MTHITCRLTAKNRDRFRNPTLRNWVLATFTFYHSPQQWQLVGTLWCYCYDLTALCINPGMILLVWDDQINNSQSVQTCRKCCQFAFFTSVNSFKRRCFCVHRKRLTLIHTRTLKMAEGILCVRFRWKSASFWSFLHSLCCFSYPCDPLMLSFLRFLLTDWYRRHHRRCRYFFTPGSGHKKTTQKSQLYTQTCTHCLSVHMYFSVKW